MSEFLDKVLNGEELPKAEIPKEEPVEKQEKPRDEQGRFKGEEKTETPAVKTEKRPEDDPEAKGLKAAIAAERKKRQDLERQLQEIQKPQKTPDVLEDPEGYKRSLEDSLQARIVDQKIDMSVAWAKKAHKDFDEVMHNWDNLVSENPLIYQQAAQQELPGEWAYNYVKRHLFLQTIGEDPEAYISQRVSEELKKREESKPSVPSPSLAGVGTRVETVPQYQGPPSLDHILKKR